LPKNKLQIAENQQKLFLKIKSQCDFYIWGFLYEENN